jgi:hypothetical protein
MVTLTYLPYSKIEELNSEERIKKILDLVKKDRIVLLEGKLKREEEAELISETMQAISKKFKGIELATIDNDAENNVFMSFLRNLLLGDRSGVTIVGPANIVKQIKKDPNKIELLMQKKRKK